MNLESFENKQYLNLETFRKDGRGVKTPVWFARDGAALFIWTEAYSGKAKRIRNSEKVRIAPSTASGEPVGEWEAARAVVNDSPQEVERVASLFLRKYGMMFRAFAFMGKLRKSRYTTIKVT